LLSEAAIDGIVGLFWIRHGQRIGVHLYREITAPVVLAMLMALGGAGPARAHSLA